MFYNGQTTLILFFLEILFPTVLYFIQSVLFNTSLYRIFFFLFFFKINKYDNTFNSTQERHLPNKFIPGVSLGVALPSLVKFVTKDEQI